MPVFREPKRESEKKEIQWIWDVARREEKSE